VNISAKTEYACIAVLELALHWGADDPVQIRRIAAAHRIPSRFLVQILLQLKGAGLVESTRGASGGYRLARSPDEITLGEVMEVIEGKTARSASTARPSPVTSALRQVWKKVARAQREMLSEVTFAQLAEQVGGQTEKMYYI
jgi:Rrf2 family protein